MDMHPLFSMPHAPAPAPGQALQDRSLPAANELSSDRLLAGRREILIRHGQSVYRLRHTSNDKLILTK